MKNLSRLALGFGTIIVLAVAVAVFGGFSARPSPPPVVQTPYDGSLVPKFVEPLPSPQIVDWRGNKSQLEIHMSEFRAPILPTGTFSAGVTPMTWVWGYTVGSVDSSTYTRDTYLGPVLIVERGTPTQLKFVNDLGMTWTTHVLAYSQSTDQTLHWADPLNNEANLGNMNVVPGQPPAGAYADNYSGPIPAAIHLHGGEVPPELDGGPDSWFTSDGVYRGHGYYTKGNPGGNAVIYTYPNSQEASPIWFHDHALGATRLNVYAGLAGGYLVVDPKLKLPKGLNEIGLERGKTVEALTPLILQDRMFDDAGQLYFPNQGINPEHPYWVPEFFGDVICVNGKAWPRLNVQAKRYRFLFLNGSNARAYEMTFQTSGGAAPAFWQIGTDGGYLDNPVRLTKLFLMPGERADVIIDFAGLAPGTSLYLKNSSAAPFPTGDPVDPATTADIMRFDVVTGAAAKDESFDPSGLKAEIRGGKDALVRLVNPALGTLAKDVKPEHIRQLTLNEIQGDGGPTEILVNNTKWTGASTRTYNDFTPITLGGITTRYSELPLEADTEVWEIVNMTMDAHPMHLHLVQFQILNRQAYAPGYMDAYGLAFPGGAYLPAFGPPLNYYTGITRAWGGNPDVTPYLSGSAMIPAANEAGWKDTILVPPGMVTRIVVRWAPTDLDVKKPHKDLIFPFDPSGNFRHGYVWHCHIIDHEDNEMMRPNAVQPMLSVKRKFKKGPDF